MSSIKYFAAYKLQRKANKGKMQLSDNNPQDDTEIPTTDVDWI